MFVRSKGLSFPSLSLFLFVFCCDLSDPRRGRRGGKGGTKISPGCCYLTPHVWLLASYPTLCFVAYAYSPHHGSRQRQLPRLLLPLALALPLWEMGATTTQAVDAHPFTSHRTAYHTIATPPSPSGCVSFPRPTTGAPALTPGEAGTAHLGLRVAARTD